jgi:hypothetical protein
MPFSANTPSVTSFRHERYDFYEKFLETSQVFPHAFSLIYFWRISCIKAALLGTSKFSISSQTSLVYSHRAPAGIKAGCQDPVEEECTAWNRRGFFNFLSEIFLRK